MEYEKKYNEAQKWIESIYSELSHEQQMEAEAFFPELKESEDERIRKEIIELVMQPTWKTEKEFHRRNELCVWLEKQGETSTILSNSSKIGNVTLSEEEQNRFAKCVLTSCASSFIDYLDAHKYEGKMCVSNGECEDIENAFHNAMWDRLHRYYCKYIEKQGEQKPVIEMKSAEESLGISSEEYNDIVNECLYGESNSSDNVEPKFKVGDWVVDNCDYVWKIEGILNQFYLLEGVEGGESRPTIEWVNKTFHLWSIQDAKDGDVLCVKYGNDEMPFIFTGKQDNVAYCALNSFGEFVLSIAEWLLKISVLPATKEQHDTLFAKMKEAGYEWNAEKKELKKISQRMISAEAKEALYDKPTDEEMKELLRTEYEKGRADTLSEMKSSWSEEDEKMIGRIRSIVEKYAFSQSAVDVNGDLCEKEYIDADNWLKSLRHQKQWKPSEEQIKTCKEVYADILSAKGFDLGTVNNELNRLEEQLKKLTE